MAVLLWSSVLFQLGSVLLEDAAADAADAVP